MADDADPIDRLEQQINGAIIDTVVSNLVSQINKLGNGRQRIDRKHRPYQTALNYLQRKGIVISKVALKTRVSRALKKQCKQIVAEVNVASSPSSSASTLTSSPTAVSTTSTEIPNNNSAATVASDPPTTSAASKPGRPKGSTKQKKAENAAKRAKCIDMIAHMYEIEKRNCAEDGERKRVEKGFLKDLIKEMKSTHGVPRALSSDTIRSRIKRGRLTVRHRDRGTRSPVELVEEYLVGIAIEMAKIRQPKLQ